MASRLGAEGPCSMNSTSAASIRASRVASLADARAPVDGVVILPLTYHVVCEKKASHTDSYVKGKSMEPRTILITGATAGIGRHAALALARAGNRVIASGRRETVLADVVTES